MVTLRYNFISFFFGKILPTHSTNIITCFFLDKTISQVCFWFQMRMRARFIAPFLTKFFCF